VINSERLILGWDIGGTKSSAVVCTAAGQVQAKATWPSQTERGPKAMLQDFLDAVTPLRQRFGAFAAVGVSIGGPLDPQHGIILSPPHLPRWDRLPLGDILAAEFKLPVTIEHDAAACLLAEHLWGGAQGATHAAYLTAGTGFGAGILLGGKVVRGPSGQTVEIGHIRLADHGPVLYGKAGSVEAFCSGTGIALLASELFPEQFPQPVPVRELAEKAQAGDAAAREVLLTAGRSTGRVCAMLGDLFSPEVIIVGSLARYLPDWWLQEVREEFAREVLPQNGAHTQIIASVLGDKLQDLSCIAPCVFKEA